MQVRYSCLGKRLSSFSKGLMMVAGLVAVPLTAKLETVPAIKPVPGKACRKAAKTDVRAVRLRSFFAKLHCPVLNLSEDFIQAADDNHLDWRLLPSISVIESSGGKAYRNNNLFGWNNGDQAFPSLRAGLDLVAFKLGRSPLYRNRDVLGKLRLYNPDASYATRVMTVMNRISPVPALRIPKPVMQQANQYDTVTD